MDDKLIVRENEWQQVYTRLEGEAQAKASAALNQLLNKQHKERKKKRQTHHLKHPDEDITTSDEDSEDYEEKDEQLRRNPRITTPTRTLSRSPSPDPRIAPPTVAPEERGVGETSTGAEPQPE